VGKAVELFFEMICYLLLKPAFLFDPGGPEIGRDKKEVFRRDDMGSEEFRSIQAGDCPGIRESLIGVRGKIRGEKDIVECDPLSSFQKIHKAPL